MKMGKYYLTEDKATNERSISDYGFAGKKT